MRASKYFLPTLKETPADAEIISHQLMLRAGMIRKLSSGLYTWLPLGVKVLRNIERIVREELEKAGAIECLMPVVQPADLWEISGRWQQYGPELLRIQDRHQRDFCLGPTHEEVITEFVQRDVRSYKQLPITLYQIQTKFRDEIRPRFGVMRAREFIMKDAYSFHVNDDSLDGTYQTMYQAYSNIFDRLGLSYRAVLADTGSIGGEESHEFHVLAQSGEDAIAFSDTSDYAANVELAPSAPVEAASTETNAELSKIATPNVKTIEEVCQALNVKAANTVKTLIVKGESGNLVALCIKGDDDLNTIKAEKHPEIAAPLTFATQEEVNAIMNCDTGSLGPVGTDIPVIVDAHAAALTEFVCGANETGHHLSGANWQRDVKSYTTADLRNVKAGDPSPDGQGKLEIARGIEVGHIFKLGKKYSEPFKLTVLAEDGKSKTLTMGCYGIGITRIVAAAIEQNHDKHGIIWPDAIAPYQVVIIPMNMQKSPRVKEAAEGLYTDLKAAGVDVLFDDRNERPGVLFNHNDLIGIPHRLVVGEKALDNDSIEYKHRRAEKAELIEQSQIVSFIKDKLVHE